MAKRQSNKECRTNFIKLKLILTFYLLFIYLFVFLSHHSRINKNLFFIIFKNLIKYQYDIHINPRNNLPICYVSEINKHIFFIHFNI